MTEFDDVKCRDCNFIINDDGCYFCQFGFEACKLRHKEKQKLVRLQDKIENVNDELVLEEYNKTITEEKEKNL